MSNNIAQAIDEEDPNQQADLDFEPQEDRGINIRDNVSENHAPFALNNN